jgi:pyridoxamine 5'-phosphate oxidase family protein
MLFTEQEVAYLATQWLGRLATVQSNRTLQASPVGFSLNAKLGTIDIGGRDMAATQKFRNLRVNSQVAFVIDDLASVDPWRPRGIEIRGTAEALADPADSTSRFPGPIIRIHPRRLISWGINPEQSGMQKRDVAPAATDR